MDLIRDETVFPSALMHCIGFEEVLSLGADGQPGGEGKDADIGSWQ